jgi:hypothetical protein
MAEIVEASSGLRAVEPTGKSFAVRIIEGDRQGSSAYYPRETLQKGRHLFKAGTRVFANHPSASERQERPERDFRDVIGWFTEDATYDGKDLYTKVQFLQSERARIKELAEAGAIGLSIRAEGEVDEASGGRVLKAFTRVHSVDVVTDAGAGGAFTQILESAIPGSAKPASESGAESNPKEETNMEFPKEVTEALTALAAGQKAILDRFEAQEAADKAAADEAKRLSESAAKPKLAEVIAKLDEAKLTAKARARVLDVFEADGDYAAAIESEKAIADEIRESLKAEPGFKGAALQESSGKDDLAAALGNIWG